MLVPLVRATVENWARLGPERALTGPVARGDEQTVAAQRAAVAERAPELLAIFDALVQSNELAGDGDRMKTITTVAELRAELTPARRAGRSIGLVPTMGAFHDGHLSLMRRARAQCDVVVVSLFVNPAQFNDAGDLAAYPRDERRDAELAVAEGVDVLFAPSERGGLPGGLRDHRVGLEGDRRSSRAPRGPGHFDGVATVVTKLLNMAGPDVAYFGQKDAQQAAMIRRLVRDLDIPVRIEICPTVREPRRARAVEPQRAAVTSRTRARDGASSGAVAGCGRPCSPAPTTPGPRPRPGSPS